MENKNIKYLGHNIRIVEDSMFIDSKILVFGDIHLGYEESNSRGGNFQGIQLKETKLKIERIKEILKMENKKIKKIIILGDLVHNFRFGMKSDFNNLYNFLEFLKALVGKNRIIFIRGNHDTTSKIILKKWGYRLLDYYKSKDICFFHGDVSYKEVIKRSSLVIIGHLHPVIRISDKYKNEKYKCFLIGKIAKKKFFVIPSFMPLIHGYILNKLQEDEKDCLFIGNKRLKNFEVIIYNEKEDKCYNFGKLKKLI